MNTKEIRIIGYLLSDIIFIAVNVSLFPNKIGKSQNNKKTSIKKQIQRKKREIGRPYFKLLIFILIVMIGAPVFLTIFLMQIQSLRPDQIEIVGKFIDEILRPTIQTLLKLVPYMLPLH